MSNKIVAMSYFTQNPIQKPWLGKHCCLVKNCLVSVALIAIRIIRHLNKYVTYTKAQNSLSLFYCKMKEELLPSGNFV